MLERRHWRIWLAEVTAPHAIAAAFLLYGLVAVGFLAINMPPFQNPDEPAHLLRAAQVADGQPVGTRFIVQAADGASQVTAGGAADPAIFAALAPFNALMFHPDVRARRDFWAPDVRWSGARVMVGFANTAVYPPVCYLPSAIGVMIGRITRLSVVQTLVVSRLLTGVAAVAVGAAAIACAGQAAAWLFALLTLPMSLAMMASVSQDALLLSCTALAGALLVRLTQTPGAPSRHLGGLVIALALTATARPPYGALALLPLTLTRFQWRWRIAAAAAVALCVVAWSALTAATALTNTGIFVGADPVAQFDWLFAHPLAVFRIAVDTLARWRSVYLTGFIGQLGWLDTSLPHAYHAVAWGMLAIAALATLIGTDVTPLRAGSRVVILLAIAASAALVFAIQYLTWTVPGSPTVAGVQGRYFLPLALAGGAMLLPVRATPHWLRLRQALIAAVLLFPVVSIAVVMRSIMLRYYLG